MRGELVGAIHLHEEAALILEDLVFHDQDVGQRGFGGQPTSWWSY